MSHLKTLRMGRIGLLAACLAGSASPAFAKPKPVPAPAAPAPPASEPASPPAAPDPVPEATSPPVTDAAPAPSAQPMAAPAPVAPPRDKLADLMGYFKWGMTVDETVEALGRQISDRYTPEIKRTSDVYVQNRLRKQIKDETEAARKTYIAFEGQKSGWDVSIIEGEFLQKNDEGMITYRETDPATNRDQQRFYFFYKGKLWKMFVAFNMEPYKGKTFKDFREAMEGRYGTGTPITKLTDAGKLRLAAVSWTFGGTILRAIDLSQFYGNFCVAVSDQSVEEALAPLRAKRTPVTKSGAIHATVSDGGGPINPPVGYDPNANIIDQITKPTGPTPAEPTTP